jgi:hypothetical protein
MFITPLTPMKTLSELKEDKQAHPNSQASGTDLPFKEIFGTSMQNLRET